MTDSRGPRPDTVDANEIERLRTRIRDLEAQLRTAKKEARDSSASSATEEALKGLTALLAAMVVLMTPPTFLTLRRWYRWWME